MPRHAKRNVRLCNPEVSGMTEMPVKFCPDCGSFEIKVIDSPATHGPLRRRRECGECHKRWTTYEIPADSYEKHMQGVARSLRALSGKCDAFLRDIDKLTQDIATARQ